MRKKILLYHSSFFMYGMRDKETHSNLYVHMTSIYINGLGWCGMWSNDILCKSYGALCTDKWVLCCCIMLYNMDERKENRNKNSFLVKWFFKFSRFTSYNDIYLGTRNVLRWTGKKMTLMAFFSPCSTQLYTESRAAT